ncbi:hypothetical protein JM654_06385 [Microbacterium oxydans]|nr:hypothetical protein [Microbacterium oxydans]
MTSVPVADGASRWDFAYDAEWYIPLPAADLLRREPGIGGAMGVGRGRALRRTFPAHRW